jgi:hypothetical protein
MHEWPVWIAAAKQDIFETDFGTGQKQTCVRPVYAAHAAAGPDGFRNPSPKPVCGQYDVPDIGRGVLADGLTVLHQFNGLAVSCVVFSSGYAVCGL